MSIPPVASRQSMAMSLVQRHLRGHRHIRSLRPCLTWPEWACAAGCEVRKRCYPSLSDFLDTSAQAAPSGDDARDRPCSMAEAHSRARRAARPRAGKSWREKRPFCSSRLYCPLPAPPVLACSPKHWRRAAGLTTRQHGVRLISSRCSKQICTVLEQIPSPSPAHSMGWKASKVHAVLTTVSGLNWLGSTAIHYGESACQSRRIDPHGNHATICHYSLALSVEPVLG